MIIERSLLFSPVQKERKIHIYLPDCYDEGQDSYPVMYFFDGHNLFYDSYATYGKCWGLKEFMDNWNKPLILVGIECGHEGDERLNEYMPYHVEKGFFSRFEGIGDQTIRWMTEELKPLIDREYRTYPFRECTAIGGSSMGGLMSLYGAVRYNHYFSKAACLSSSVYPCMPQILKDLEECPLNPDTRIYLSWGTKEAKGLADVTRTDTSSLTFRQNRTIANKLIQKQVTVDLYCQVGGAHCEADWEKQVPGFMEFLWKQV